MDNCPRCGEALGPAAGRYCINCGQRVDGAVPVEEYADWRTDTSERSMSQVAEDESFGVLPVSASSPPTQPAPVVPPSDPERPHRAQGRAKGAPVGWIAAFVGMLLVALLGAWLFFGGSGDEPASVARETPDSTPSSSAPSPSPTPTPKPSTSPTKKSRAEPVDLTREVDVKAPKTAPASTDSSGRKVTYDATQMLDGVPETCWRMVGDGSGSTLVFTLPEETEVTELGLINGYAKTAHDARGPLDWYHGNRRILRAVWTFDDGTEIAQDLLDTTSMQTIKVDHVSTTTLELTLDEVSKPGQGRAARNYTAISDVSLLGVLG